MKVKYAGPSAFELTKVLARNTGVSPDGETSDTTTTTAPDTTPKNTSESPFAREKSLHTGLVGNGLERTKQTVTPNENGKSTQHSYFTPKSDVNHKDVAATLHSHGYEKMDAQPKPALSKNPAYSVYKTNYMHPNANDKSTVSVTHDHYGNVHQVAHHSNPTNRVESAVKKLDKMPNELKSVLSVFASVKESAKKSVKKSVKKSATKTKTKFVPKSIPEAYAENAKLHKNDEKAFHKAMAKYHDNMSKHHDDEALKNFSNWDNNTPTKQRNKFENADRWHQQRSSDHDDLKNAHLNMAYGL